MSLNRKPADIIKKLRYFGFGGAMTLLGRRALIASKRGEAFREFLIVLSDPKPTPKALAAAKNHSFRMATLSDLERLSKDPSTNILERDIESFKEGCLCLLQLDGENLVGYTWIVDSRLIDIGWGFHVNVPDDMVYNYNGYTTPEYRGTAYQTLRHMKALDHIRSMGKHRLLGYIDHLNLKSLRGSAKGGYKQIGVLSGTRRGGAVSFELSIQENCWSTGTHAGPRHALL